ncbi:hypothetical protein BBP40_009624 [Aspergillus hancockii]|nr:hypothetical protein BBP40_009624 [Aspergillus hancockii]
MLGDADIQALDNHLGTILRDNQQHHENLQNLLQQFHLLLDNYNRLKSDYEEARESREKYKKLARGQERNPFALVLVDGDGYLFKEHLVKAGCEGGITAARLLSDSIKELLQEQLGTQADQCRIMVRIYSNILGLSKSLARIGLCGNEARSLSPFAASFTRSQDLFDYIDAGDKKEGADYKIRASFTINPRDQDYYAKFLPKMTPESQDSIAINRDGERIDTYCPMPSQDEWEAYYRRAKRHKLCNKFHLGGECGNLSCDFDHSPIEPTCLKVMIFIMRQHACARGAGCRSTKCYLGHICQKDGCKGTKPCKFSRQAHLTNLQVAQWLTPFEPEDESPVSESYSDSNSTTDPNNTFSYLMRDVL